MSLIDRKIQDRKVQQQPDYGVKKWMGEILVGYKNPTGNKLTLKKHPNGDLEIVDGDKLVGSYTTNGNIFWGEPNTCGSDVFQRFRNLKKQDKAKEIMRTVSESMFNVEVIEEKELTEEEKLELKEKEYLNARGKMVDKIRRYFVEQNGDTEINFFIAGENSKLDKDKLAEYVLSNFKNAFNKYGLKLAEWVLEKKITDRKPSEKLKLTMALNALVELDNDKYDENFNGLSIEELLEEYSGAVKAAREEEKKAINNMPVRHTGYRIVKILDDKHARSFAKYLTIPGYGSQWCITAGSYNGYVDPSAGKAEVFYFLLAPGWDEWERVPPRTSSTPKDDYGNSMIAVSVRSDGSIRTATTRYNHSAGGNGEKDYTDLELSKIIGMSIYKACPPLSSPLDLLRDIKVKGIKEVEAGNRKIMFYGDAYYILQDNQLVTDTWDNIIRFTKLVALKNKRTGDILGYIVVQKSRKEEEGRVVDAFEEYFMGFNKDLGLVLNPTNKGPIENVAKILKEKLRGA